MERAMKIEIGPYTEGDEARLVEIKIHNYDTWAMDSTLAILIAPMLKQLKDTKHGAPFVDDEDVPEHLRLPDIDEYGIQKTHFEKWDWVLDEMIWGFSNYDEVHYGFDVFTSQRLANATRLFGKYYQNLWD